MYCHLAVLMAKKDPKLSQRKLADSLGMAVSTIGRLFNNDFDRVDKATIEKLCEYFKCDISDLFTLEDIEEK